METWLGKSGLDWPALMYQGFSDAAHHRALEWATPDVLIETWHFKATRLDQCVQIYGHIGALAIELVQPNPDGSFSKAVNDLRADPALQLALEGQLDA